MRRTGSGMPERRALDPIGAFLALAIVICWWYFLAIESSPDDWAFDFRQFWQGANDVVNGISPYPSAEMLARCS